MCSRDYIPCFFHRLELQIKRHLHFLAIINRDYDKLCRGMKGPCFFLLDTEGFAFWLWPALPATTRTNLHHYKHQPSPEVMTSVSVGLFRSQQAEECVQPWSGFRM
eukprot:s615_g6.t1